MHILASDRRQDDFLRLFVHVYLNARALRYSELSSNRRRDYDLAFGCRGCFHLKPTFPKCGDQCTCELKVSQQTVGVTSCEKLYGSGEGQT